MLSYSYPYPSMMLHSVCAIQGWPIGTVLAWGKCAHVVRLRYERS